MKTFSFSVTPAQPAGWTLRILQDDDADDTDTKTIHEELFTADPSMAAYHEAAQEGAFMVSNLDPCR